MPAYVWDGWERWMEANPDHPAHRDQMACDHAALQMAQEGGEITSKQLMEFRLRDPKMNE